MKVKESGPFGRYIGCTLYSNFPWLYSIRKFWMTCNKFRKWWKAKTDTSTIHRILPTHFCDKRLYFELRKSASQAHSLTVPEREAGERMVLLFIAFQPSLWFKIIGVLKISFHIAYDVMLEYHLYLKCTSILMQKYPEESILKLHVVGCEFNVLTPFGIRYPQMSISLVKHRPLPITTGYIL